jgi:cation:H+ antiporter
MVAMSLDGSIDRAEATLFFALVIAYTVFLIRQSREASKSLAAEYEGDVPTAVWDSHWAVQLTLLVAGLLMLVMGADWLVGAAVAFAQAFGVSDLVIGLTVVAIGTSMPEIATSIIAALRGQRDIAVGNVVGSNMFNIFAVLGVTGMISATGVPVPEAARNFDLWVMLAVAIACIPVMLTGREIARWEGGVFLGYYAAYTAYLVLAAQQHDELPAFSSIMLSYVIPLTVITLIVSFVRRNGRASGTPIS